MNPYTPPPYRNPKQAAAQRASMIRTLIWLAAVPPLLFALMIYGYSDQAPAALRSFTASLDAAFGSPVWNFLSPSK